MIKKYGITLVPAEESDAAFIVGIRTNAKKSRFISATSTDILAQQKWLKEYKDREKRGEEHYFIAIDEGGEPFATYRIYNFRNDTVEIGSFVTTPDYDKPINVVKLDILIKEYVFEVLKYKQLNFEVRKQNFSVVNYHKKFQPLIIAEDERNFYFSQKKEIFEINKSKFLKILK